MVDSSNAGKLAAAHAAVLLRRVAIRECKYDGPYQANHADDVKYSSPAVPNHDHYGQRRTDRRSESTGSVADALHKSALLPGKPQLHATSSGRKRTCLSHPQHEAHGPE